jgi:glycosyltransferase involved in cell wall biosynthesis
MKIALVAPLHESVPPKLYGGTERVVAYLADELCRQGHDVTLFASGDSRTEATLVAACRRSLRLDHRVEDHLAHHLVLLEKVFQRAHEFDFVHFHVDYLHFPLSRRHLIAQLTTLHGRLDIPDLVPLYREFAEMPLVSISDAQRAPLPWANWVGTVHHGLPEDLYRFRPEAGDYLAFVGRVSPEKGLDRAIAIARRARLPLRIAAKVDRADREYHERVVEPLLQGPRIEFVGEIRDHQKDDFLGRARALLFPIEWPEPFGLVMIEAMACGTPVIAYRQGSVPEVMEDGRTGFVVDGIEQAVDAVGRLGGVSRAGCREVFERRFTARRMARDYVETYARLLAGRRDAAREAAR